MMDLETMVSPNPQYILGISFEEIKHHILPIVKVRDLLATRKELKRKRILDPSPGKSEWRHDLSLNYIEEEIIASTVIDNREPLRFVLGTKTEANDRTDSSRPDCYGALQVDHELSTARFANTNQNSDMDNWFDIAWVYEYGMETSEVENSKKMLWSMCQIMRRDFRRRCTFGITVQGSAVCVWFCSRQAIVVSKPFDLVKEPDKYIYVFVSLSFASAIELGWDPTMALGFIDNIWVWDITVFDDPDPLNKTTESRYRMAAILSDEGVSHICGRGTRVLEAHKLDVHGHLLPNAQNVAIKGFWVKHAHKQERPILDNILALTPPEERKYFLTVFAEGGVLLNGKQDDTTDILMRGIHFNYDYTEVGGQLLAKKPPGLPFERFNVVPDWSLARRHHRTVVNEIGTPIDKLQSMHGVLLALIDATKGLEILHRHGYVHRNISIGNIIVVEGKARLCNMEYGKIIDHDAKSEPFPIGTLPFLSIEAQTHIYHFAKSQEKVYDFNTPEPPRSRPIWNHNPLHDIESLWWIFLYLLCYKSVALTPGDVDFQQLKAELQQQFDMQHDLYQNPSLRGLLLLNDSYLLNQVSPDNRFYRYFLHLDAIRQALCRQVAIAEKDVFNIDKNAFQGIYASVIETLQVALQDPLCPDFKLCDIKDTQDYYNREAKDNAGDLSGRVECRTSGLDDFILVLMCE